jgi:hypothetical protein
MTYSEIIADNLSKAGWSRGCVSAVDSRGRTIWIAHAHRGDGKRFVAGQEKKSQRNRPRARAFRSRCLLQCKRESHYHVNG